MDNLPLISVRSGSHAQTFHGTWYRGEGAKFVPSRPMLKEPGAIDRYVLDGWLPPAPLIDRTTPVTAFGSCFAFHISQWLAERGYAVNGGDLELDAHIIRFGEGMVNSFAILEQFRWALEGLSLEDGLWFGPGKEIALPTEEIRASTRALLLGTRVFILTLGLSEIWVDKVSGRAFWRAVPLHLFDPSRHAFRVSSVGENLANLAAICDLVAKHVPDASIVFTLSPIPLMATFRPVSCITANAASKAILRVAIDELMRSGRKGVHYFPSYEIVKDVYVDAFQEDYRHLKPPVIDFIMSTFARHYCRA
jgi:hypothetical protein